MTQDQAVSILKTGASVFLTGEAGTDKVNFAGFDGVRGRSYYQNASESE